MALWLGAAIFFSVVVAPAVFGVLRSFDVTNAGEIAGTIVTRTLSVVNITGAVVGVLVLLTLLMNSGPGNARTKWIVEIICVVVMIAATAIGHWVIAARMRGLRVAMQVPIDRVPLSDARRIAFQTLHGYSVTALGLAMIAALLSILLLARSLRS
jgi:uncharacterized protein DUF4149